MNWIGVGYVAPRLISILSAFGCFLLIYLIVKKEYRNPIPGLLAAGIYAACYRFTGVWMDLSKVDSLFMLFILAGFLTSLGKPGKAQMVVSGVLFALAYFTKQLALPLVLVWAPISLILSRGKTWPIWLITLALSALAFWGLDAYSQGWFSFYTFKTLSVHPRVSDWGIFWRLILSKMWPSFLLLLTILALQGRFFSSRLKPPEKTWVYLGYTAGLLATSWSIYLKIWTYTNDLMPACAGMAIISGLGVGALSAGKLSASSPEPEQPNRKLIFPQAAALILICLQFGLLLYNPLELIPTGRLERKAQKMVQKVHDLPGEVLSFNRGYINEQAGKTTYLHSAAYADVITGHFTPGSESYSRQQATLTMFNQALAEQKFNWIATDIPESFWLPYYVRTGDFIQDKDVRYPGRISQMAPSSLFSRNPIVYGGELPLNNPTYNDLFDEGWGEPQANGGRMISERAEVEIALASSTEYELFVRVQPSCDHGMPRFERIQVFWNSGPLGSVTFQSCATHMGKFVILRGWLRENALNRLTFQLPSAPGSQAESAADVASPDAAEISTLRFIQK
jgi:hypothetical protein